MATFETKFNVGDKVFKKSGVIDWANGSSSKLVSYMISRVDARIESGKSKIIYRTGNGDYIDESEAVALEDAKAIAIKHLSARLSAVAAETIEAIK